MTLRYFIFRLAWMVPWAIALAALSFLLSTYIPGTARDARLSESNRDIGSSLRPAPFNFRVSDYYDENVEVVIGERLPISLFWGTLSFLITHLIAVPLGRKRTHPLCETLLNVLYSIPPFTLGIVLLVLFGGGTLFHIVPLQGSVSDEFSTFSWPHKVIDMLWHAIVPVLCASTNAIVVTSRLVNHTMQSQYEMEYFRTAVAKGLTSAGLFRHTLKNLLLPLAASLPQWCHFFFSGGILIEALFHIRGIGLLAFESVIHRDYSVLCALVIMIGMIQSLVRMFSDWLVTRLDPRIRIGK